MLRIVVLATGAVLAEAGVAVAADVHVTPGSPTVTYTAAPGEANAVVVSAMDATSLRITDTGATIVPGAGCRADSESAVVCRGIAVPEPPPDEDSLPPYPTSDFLEALRIAAGDQDDELGSQGPRLFADGGPGDDVLHGVAWNDVLDGGSGRDRLFSDGRLIDRDPADVDEFAGRGGSLLDYSPQLGPLTVDLLTQRSSAGDALRAIHGVVGSQGGDTLLGSDVRDHLSGWSGADRISGKGGNDLLIGGAGDDEAHGAAGRDRLRGSPGADRLSGGDESDHLSGGDDGDRLIAGAGDDRLRGGRGVDSYSCGPGDDAVAGPRRQEIVPVDCEAIRFEYDDGRTIAMTPRPVSRSRGRLVFSLECPRSDGSFSMGYGSLAVRDGASRRLLAEGRVSRRAGHGCGDRGARTLRFVAPLTAYGQARMRRRSALDAVVSVRGPGLPSAAWRIPLLPHADRAPRTWW